MRTPSGVTAQLAAIGDDALRILVVGAGVAGLTLVQLLRDRGLHPVLIERNEPDSDEGYNLAMMPLVEPTIRALGIKPAYLATSEGLHRYRLHGHTGKPLREYSFDALLGQFGPYRGIERAQLLDLVAADHTPVAFGTTLTALTQDRSGAHARLHSTGGCGGSPDTGSTGLDADIATNIDADFDLVVAADGLHSATRGMVLNAGDTTTYDTGWGGWVVWADGDDNPDLVSETWGTGCFLGTYPVRQRVGAFVGGPRDETACGPAAFAQQVRRKLRVVNTRSELALDAVSTAVKPFYWSFSDTRANTWSTGRVVLLGDAAAGFLPTAGVGAAMAMESATALAGRLMHTRTNGTAPSCVAPAEIPALLRSYEHAQRPRVEAAQNNSRSLARIMFQRHQLTAAVRDAATRVITMQMALGSIKKLHVRAPK